MGKKLNDLKRVEIKKGKETIKVFPIDLDGWLKAGWVKANGEEAPVKEKSEGTLKEGFSEVNKAPGVKLIEESEDLELLKKLLEDEVKAKAPRKWAVDGLTERVAVLEKKKEETL